MALAVRPPVAPMLARLVRDLPVGDELVYEPKWDGFRCLAFREAGVVDLRSRNDRPLTRYFPEVAEALAAGTDAVLDGELLVLDATGAADFPSLLARLHPAPSRVQELRAATPATFVAFDALAVGGDDLRDVAFARRRAALEVLVGTGGPGFGLTPQTTDAVEARSWLARATGRGIDGVVVRALDGRYDAGRRSLVKVKSERTADCVVAGFRLDARDLGVGSLLLGLFDDGGSLRHVGVASGFAAALRRALLDDLRPHVVDLAGHPWEHGFTIGASPLGRLRGAAGRWTPDMPLDWLPLRPDLVCEVSYGQVDVDRLRHPGRFRRWRPDRDPASCRIEQLDDAGAARGGAGPARPRPDLG